MKANARAREESTGDGGLVGRSIESCTVGVDGDGCTHVWHKGANQVVVSDGRRLEYRQLLGDRPLGDWIKHVDEARGWLNLGPFARAAAKADASAKEGGR